MMPRVSGPLRVLLIDDSALIRQALRKLIDAEPDLTVCGVARDGQIGLQKVAELAPDLIVLDVEMPVLDGLATLRRLRASHPSLPVVMFSALTRPGVKTTIDALLIGASDYVPKPSGGGDVAAEVRASLIPKIRLHGQSAGRLERPPSSQSIPTSLAAAADGPKLSLRTRAKRAGLVVIGVSTGGPQALLALFSELPPDLGVPIVIVQHMLPGFLPHLAFRLSGQSEMVVRLAEDGQPLDAAAAYLAPGGTHLEIAGTRSAPRLRLTDAPPVQSCRPAADVLFRSAARTFDEDTLGVVLTGMGRDGLEGSRAIVAAGGAVIAQDQASSVIYGMPRVVAEAGLASATLPLEAMAAAIVRRVRTAVA